MVGEGRQGGVSRMVASTGESCSMGGEMSSDGAALALDSFARRLDGSRQVLASEGPRRLHQETCTQDCTRYKQASE